MEEIEVRWEICVTLVRAVGLRMRDGKKLLIYKKKRDNYG